LGEKLFSDPILSGSKDRSYAICHLPEKAFADELTVPYSLDNKTKLTRNTPTLWDSALQTRQFFDTRADILENQLKEVVHNTDEMKGSLKESVDDLKSIKAYVSLFKEAYSEEKEPINLFNIANAISSYIRSLISVRSRFDEYMPGDKTKLTSSEKMALIFLPVKAKCATCHFIPLLTDWYRLSLPKQKQKYWVCRKQNQNKTLLLILIRANTILPKLLFINMLLKHRHCVILN
jgi:cytochrome c peroxidase